MHDTHTLQKRHKKKKKKKTNSLVMASIAETVMPTAIPEPDCSHPILYPHGCPSVAEFTGEYGGYVVNTPHSGTKVTPWVRFDNGKIESIWTPQEAAKAFGLAGEWVNIITNTHAEVAAVIPGFTETQYNDGLTEIAYYSNCGTMDTNGPCDSEFKAQVRPVYMTIEQIEAYILSQIP